ncbi:MAG: hypothetical protein A2W31_17785 [Planctomycetes bacterium RBG_16_64_10]|nr:MAG: hypothetical protein A2W31_17785 [Planctomycetes bacterium RBG_16_64_10]
MLGLVLLAGQPPAADDQITLVKDRAPQATIVISRQPSAQARDAANILQQVLEKISGARLLIVGDDTALTGHRILVGHSQAVRDLGVDPPSGVSHAMDEEGFVARTIGGNLVLAGNEDGQYRGTIFAVYDFLEQLGCRWFFPGPFGEVLPATADLAIGPMNREQRPSFRFRNLWYSGWMPVSDQDQQWLRTWYDQNKLTPLSLSLPGDGSITRLAPPETYFASHPHIYAVDPDGQRVKDMLCLTEPDTVRIAVQTIKDTFRNDPNAISFGFAPPDGHPMCHCKRCQQDIPGFTGKGYGDPSLSDSWFRFANRIATEVYKDFPDRWLFTNGYANRVRLPERIDRFSPNLGIQSAIISSCTLHRIGDPKCWQRVLYKQLLDDWTERLKCVFIYDYDPGTSLVGLPFPALHNLKHDLPYFQQRGAWGFWTEANNSWMVTHLNYYVRGKLMWDVSADVKDLVHDYCAKFYGPAQEPIEKYIWTLEDAIEQTTVHETWGQFMPWRVVLPPVVDALDALMAAAEQQAQEPITKQRVHLLRLVHDHMKAYLAMEQAVAAGEFQAGVQQADNMLAIRDQVAQIGPGLLPHTPDWVKSSRTSLEGHKTAYQELADKAGGKQGQLLAMLPRRWEFKPDPQDIGVIYQWHQPGTGGTWDTIDTTLYWQAQGYQDDEGWGMSGKAWYRTTFDLPATAANKPVWLSVGAVYNRGLWIWVNGVLQEFERGPHWRPGQYDVRTPLDVNVTDWIRPGTTNHVAILVHTDAAGRDPRGGLHRRVFLWTPK